MKKLLIISITLLSTLCVMAKEKTKELPPLKFSNLPVSIQGVIKKADANQTDSVFVSYSPLVGGESTEVALLNAKGGFSLQITPGSTIMVHISHAENKASVLVNPGEAISFTLDETLIGNPKKNAWKFTGSQADFNNDMANAPDSISGALAFRSINGMGLNQFKGKDLNEFKRIVTDCYQKYAAKMDALPYCDAFKDYHKTTARIYMGSFLASGNTILNYVNQTRKERPFPDGYFTEFLQENPMQRNAAIYGPFGGILDEYSNEMGRMMHHQFQLPAGYEKVSIAKKYFSSIEKEFVPLTDAQVDSVQSIAPEFASQIIKANDELKAKIEKNKNNPDVVIKSISADLKGEDIFKALVAPYKGKQVLVDFWATWCGPCRAAMKTIQPVKEELWGKVSFIYVTGPSSPKGTWNNMIPDIHGDHYYVTEEQWNSLLNQFESQGIPTYVIVDKEGNVQNKYIGYPGNDTMKAELSK